MNKEQPECACGWPIPRVFAPVEQKRSPAEVVLECAGCFVPIRVKVLKPGVGQAGEH